jgi:S-methylmethionine-dependent homocysteine/selenocysteine methylase
MTDITLLDGGMGQELVARSGDDPTPLWATRVMLDHPGLVRDIHADYFAAGATIATTNTYAIHHDRLDRVGLDAMFHALHLRALAEAHEARAAHGSGRIAGSLGPLQASYRPDLTEPLAEAAPKYAEIARILAPHVDLILIETAASIEAAEGAVIGAQAAGKPVWLSISVDDRDGTKLRSGEPVADLQRLLQHPIAALLANCSVPEAMADALAALKPLGKPFRRLCQRLHPYLRQLPERRAHGEGTHPPPRPHAREICRFRNGLGRPGATIVGGCCEVGPAHIRHLRDRLIAEGHRIV